MMPPSLTSRLTSCALLCVVLIVYIKNFWLNEDAFIVFRSLEQLQSGNGAVWNAGERVQVYTSVAWYWLLAAANAVVRDVFAATIIVSTVLMLAWTHLARRLFGDHVALWFLLLVCLLSKGFFDYTSSGLENILAYTALLALYAACRQMQQLHVSTAQQYSIAAITASIPLIRHDLVLLCAPVFALLLWQQRGHLRRMASLLLIAGMPLLLWTIASLVYYGLPLPNTAYAKLQHGFPNDLILQTGSDFFYWNARIDPITMATIVTGAAVALWKLRSWQRALAIGVLLHCVYLFKSGGDYMLGRFLSFPFLVAALLLADFLQRFAPSRTICGVAAMLALIYLWMVPDTPVRTPWTYGRNTDANTLLAESRRTGVLNQRALHYQTTLAAWYHDEQRYPGVLESLRRDGENLRRSNDRTAIRGALGTTGFYAGPAIHIVDYFALTDPLLSHLPAVRRQVSGHFEREVVAGYIERLQDGTTALRDANLETYYRQVVVLTRSDRLLSWQRMQTIIDFNLGRYDSLLDDYRRTIAERRLSVMQKES